MYLAVALVALIVGWIVITAIGKAVPDQIPVITVTIGGGLVGVIVLGNASCKKTSGSLYAVPRAELLSCSSVNTCRGLQNHPGSLIVSGRAHSAER